MSATGGEYPALHTLTRERQPPHNRGRPAQLGVLTYTTRGSGTIRSLVSQYQ